VIANLYQDYAQKVCTSCDSLVLLRIVFDLGLLHVDGLSPEQSAESVADQVEEPEEDPSDHEQSDLILNGEHVKDRIEPVALEMANRQDQGGVSGEQKEDNCRRVESVRSVVASQEGVDQQESERRGVCHVIVPLRDLLRDPAGHNRFGIDQVDGPEEETRCNADREGRREISEITNRMPSTPTPVTRQNVLVRLGTFLLALGEPVEDRAE